jgi:hypothetical protein
MAPESAGDRSVAGEEVPVNRERASSRQYWAAAGYIGRGRTPWIDHWSLSQTRAGAANRAGKARNEADPRLGWERLKTDGWKIIRVTLSGEMPE